MKEIKKGLKYRIIFLITVTILVIISTLVTAQYNHVMTDPEGDIILETYTEKIENSERPNIDITKIQLSETNGIVNISLTVKGLITSSEDIHYNILLKDGDQWHADIFFNNEICKMEWFLKNESNEVNLDVSGIGTNNLNISFSIEDCGKPSYLYISGVNTFEYVYNESGNFESYFDSRVPENDEIPINQNKIPSGNKANESPGFIFLLIGLSLLLASLIYYPRKKQ